MEERRPVEMLSTVIPMTDEQIADADRMRWLVGELMAGRIKPDPEYIAARDAARDALYSANVDDLTADEREAVRALYADPDIEVGSEGIGGFYAGQAEATIRTLRKAGYRVVRQ